MSPELLAAALEDHRDELTGFCLKRGGILLRFETAEDLAQGVLTVALERMGDVEFRGDRELRAWLFTIAHGYLANRRAHWSALKRRSGDLLRITFRPADTPGKNSQGGPGCRGARCDRRTDSSYNPAILPP